MTGVEDEWVDTPRCPECRKELDWQLSAIDGHIAIAFTCRAHGQVSVRDPLP
jgi:uncharacterized radical SAM superfamily Fe-S cluster-containing enzyme